MLICSLTPITTITSNFNGPQGVKTAHMSYSAIATNKTHVVH